jgi:PKD repeat protein
MTRTHTVVVFAFTLLAAGCTVDQAAVPTVSGPSEFGLSVTLSAVPDQLPRDGSSQSVVTIAVRDAAGRPVAGQRLAIASTTGTVSQDEVVTDSGGRAAFAFVAPSPSVIGGNVAIINVTPIGNDFGNAAPRSVAINLMGLSNRTAPSFASDPFRVTPSAPEAGASTRFDATGTLDSQGRPLTGVFDEGAACMDACSFSWNFGDGATGSGRIVTHTYAAGRTYNVTLTVTDAAGSSASAAKTVTVSAIAAPTVTLAVSPNPPLAGQPAVLTASATPATGHSIVRYEWNFGDGTSQTTTVPTVTHTYSNLGTHVARVTATDDVGQTGSAVLSFNIVGTGIFASFTVSPSNPVPSSTVSFNGSASIGAGGASIVKWSWDFGNGTRVDETDAFASTSYSAVGTYTVTLTVTDSGGRTGTTTRTVTVTVNQP